MMCGCEDKMLKNVYETGLALDDAALFLDTHPADREAMNYYRYVQRMNQEAIRAYEQAYGPLMINQVTSDNWSWVKSPWPWEGGEC